MARAIARVDRHGRIVCSKAVRLTPGEWTWVLAHCLLHLGFGHLGADGPTDDAGRVAACVAVTRFQREVKLGTEPDFVPADLPTPDEEVLARQWRIGGIPAGLERCGVGGTGPDLGAPHRPTRPTGRPRSGAAWPRRRPPRSRSPVAYARRCPARSAASASGNARSAGSCRRTRCSAASRPDSPSWPTPALARAWDISIAAVSAEAGEIYVNPLVPA